MTILRPISGALVTLCVTAALGGCYSYVPVENPSPGTTVRVQVPLRSAVDNPNAPPQALGLEGVVMSSGDSLVLVTQTRRELGQFRVIAETDTFRVARSGLLSVEQQYFSKPKTFALTAFVTGSAVGLVLLALDAAGGGEGPGNGGDPVTQGAVRIPFVVFKDLLGAAIR